MPTTKSKLLKEHKTSILRTTWGSEDLQQPTLQTPVCVQAPNKGRESANILQAWKEFSSSCQQTKDVSQPEILKYVSTGIKSYKLIHTKDTFVAGSTRHRFNQWLKNSQDKWILQ